MKATPRVSVVVPAYGAARYLDACLGSVRAQTFRDFEVIVVDDGSLDDTYDQIRPFLSDPRFRLLQQPNRGVAVARNRGLAYARGEAVQFLDADDCLAQHTIDWGWKALDTFPEAVFVRFRSQNLPENGTRWDDSPSLPIPQATHTPLKDFLALPHSVRRTASACLFLFRRDFISRFRFLANVRHEDFEFSFKVLANAPCGVFLDAPLYVYRQTNVSRSRCPLTTHSLDDYDRVLRRLLTNFPCKSVVFADFRRYVIAPSVQAFCKIAWFAGGSEGRAVRRRLTELSSRWLAERVLAWHDLPMRWRLRLLWRLLLLRTCLIFGLR